MQQKQRPNAQSSHVVGIQTSKACFTLKILLQGIKCKPHFTFEFLSNVSVAINAVCTEWDVS